MNILEAIKSGREVQTKNGYSVRILTTEARSAFPIVGLAFDGLYDISVAWNKDGASSALGISEFDLVVKSKKVIKWINIYKYNDEITTGGNTYASEREASVKGKTSASYICTKSIEIEI